VHHMVVTFRRHMRAVLVFPVFFLGHTHTLFVRDIDSSRRKPGLSNRGVVGSVLDARSERLQSSN